VSRGRLRAVSFDLDGTLYELPALRRSIRALALRRAASPCRSWRELRALAAARRAMNRVRRQGGDRKGLELGLPRETVLAYERRWYVEGLRRSGARAGARDALAAVEAQGLVRVLITDHPVQGKLDALGLAGSFEHVVVGEEVGYLKPSPVPFRAALDRLGIAAAELLHVGDRADTDDAGARQAGCASLIVPARGSLLAALGQALQSRPE
jgi:HAD superfamily hydrolase (TIGR01549 family)